MPTIQHNATGSTRRILAVAALILAALAIFVLVVWLRSPGEASPQETVPGLGEAAPLDEEPQQTVGEPLIPDSEANGLRFEQVGTGWYPLSADHGPSTFTDSRSTGFEQTEGGAALAAIHIFNRWNPQNVEGWEATVDEQVRGPGAVELKAIIALADVDNEVLDTSDQAAVGWTVTAFNPLEAQVDVWWLERVNGVDLFVRMPMRLVWESDDWRLVIPDSGTYSGLVELVDIEDDPPQTNFYGAFE